MPARWRSGLAAILVTALTCGLVVLDATDTRIRDWWVDHAFNTAIVTALLVLLMTILVIDQIVERRQAKDRSRAVGAQAEIRDYALALMVSAPVLINDPVSRTVLEQAQRLGVLMTREAASIRSDGPSAPSQEYERAVARLGKTVAPLVARLRPEEAAAIAAT